MEFNIKIDKEKKVQTSIHSEGESLPEIELGMKLAIKELQNQLERPDLASPPQLNFLYANTPDGSLVALYNGKLEIEFDQWKEAWLPLSSGTIYNPPRPPSVVECPVATTFNYSLTFENPIPDSWRKDDFYLQIGDLHFTIESSITYKDGKTITSCSDKDRFKHVFYQRNQVIEQSK